MSFAREQVAAVAALANLDLDPSETDLLARQLGDILAYADEVRQIDTTGVPPTASVVMQPLSPAGTRDAADRADETRPSLDRDEALANAPDPAVEAGFFRVPRVIA